MIWKQVSTNENPFMTAPLFIEVPVSSQENEWSSICVLEESIFASLYDFSIVFCNCSDSVVFLLSFLK